MDKHTTSNKFKGSKNKMLGSSADLLPNWLVFTAFFISFAVPNLVFSGRYFFDTLHIMKWTVTMVPIAIMVLIVGVKFTGGWARSASFSLDTFGLAWLLLVVLITLQPLYISLTSTSTFLKEWFYFACLFGVYFLSYNVFRSRSLHRAILLGGCINASINVVFAELLIRGLNGGYPFILDVPGNYIGNTAQQEMFGLWMSMMVLNGVFLHLSYIEDMRPEQRAYKQPMIIINILLLSVNAWGLWSSTARGAILSLAVAFVILILSFWRSGQKRALRASLKILGLVIVFLAVVLAASSALETGRGSALVGKMQDMINNPTAVGDRASIWRTSWEAYLKEPITGVGIGHYKWHFLDAQRLMYEKYPELYDRKGYNWQFTYWAHSEYIQWLAETGLIGAIILGAMGIWWLYSFIKALIGRQSLQPMAIWGIAMTFLLWFDALFSRPFHRIENSVWMALAFALANREILVDPIKLKMTETLRKLFGILTAGVAIYGLYFLAGGLYGDQMLYKAIAQRAGALEKQALIQKAEAQMMSRDDALEQQAQLIINVGKMQGDNDVIQKGLNSLYDAFLRQPTSKMLFDLLGTAQEIGDQDMMRKLTVYLSPSMYRVQPVSQ